MSSEGLDLERLMCVTLARICPQARVSHDQAMHLKVRIIQVARNQRRRA